MKTRHLLPPLLLALSLAACSGDDTPANASTGTGAAAATTAEENTTLGKVVREATDKARKEMVEGNFTLKSDGQPKAEITADGHLLIDGKDVATTAEQRARLLEYRQQIQGIALAGMDIGVAGANLGTRAAGEALKGVFSGNTEGIEERLNAEADKLKAEAQKICERMPAMLATQQALATALPAFAPYATMDQSDIDDCGK